MFTGPDIGFTTTSFTIANEMGIRGRRKMPASKDFSRLESLSFQSRGNGISKTQIGQSMRAKGGQGPY